MPRKEPAALLEREFIEFFSRLSFWTADLYFAEEQEIEDEEIRNVLKDADFFFRFIILFIDFIKKNCNFFVNLWIELIFEIVVLQSNLFKISRKYEYMNINMKIFIFLVRLNLRNYRSILSILINWIILFKKKSQAKN